MRRASQTRSPEFWVSTLWSFQVELALVALLLVGLLPLSPITQPTSNYGPMLPKTGLPVKYRPVDRSSAVASSGSEAVARQSGLYRGGRELVAIHSHVALARCLHGPAPKRAAQMRKGPNRRLSKLSLRRIAIAVVKGDETGPNYCLRLRW